MKVFFLMPLLLAIAACAVCADTAYEPADDILARVVDQLPREHLRVTGDLFVRRPRGVEVEQLGFEMDLEWHTVPSRSTYTIRDAFGDRLEQLVVTRDGQGVPRYAWAGPDGRGNGAPPALFAPIQQSDVSWADLSLSFLWWPGGRVVGEARVKGRDCLILEVPAPARVADASTPYSAVRLWIDREVYMMLRAVGLDAQGGTRRELWVRSLKKLDDRWMIKDMEIQAHPVVHRTRLHVREVTGAGNTTVAPGADAGSAAVPFDP